MRLLSLFLVNCLQCSHYTSLYCENTWELSTCKKFNSRYADMCRMDEGKCGKEAQHFLPKKDLLLDNPNNKNSSDGLSFSNSVVFNLRNKIKYYRIL